MDSSEKKQLFLAANRVRQHIIEGTFNAKSGHPGGSLSAADVITYLYMKEMKVDPDNPKWEDRDRFVLSKGHAAPALYGALAVRGFFPEDEIKNLRKPSSFLQGHPDMKGVPGSVFRAWRRRDSGGAGLGGSHVCRSQEAQQPHDIY